MLPPQPELRFVAVRRAFVLGRVLARTPVLTLMLSYKQEVACSSQAPPTRNTLHTAGRSAQRRKSALEFCTFSRDIVYAVSPTASSAWVQSS
jgi:hypothetical protein